MTCSSCAGGLANRLCGLGWVTSILIVAGQDAADGTPFGRYRLIELLGRGGMGEVWRAFDTDTDRIVALKVLPPHLSEGVDFQRRFRREAHAAARLNNPHVIPIHHYGEIDGRLYVDMRLIDGRDLHSVLADGPLAPARAVRIIEQVAKALHAAHKVGLVHRDVKPSNILLDEDDFAYLIDFGIARAAGETSLTATGGFIGSWPYMAPERFGPQEVDARADVYALACVLYQCLTGHTPYPGNSLEQAVRRSRRDSATRTVEGQSERARRIRPGHRQGPRQRPQSAVRHNGGVSACSPRCNHRSNSSTTINRPGAAANPTRFRFRAATNDPSRS